MIRGFIGRNPVYDRKLDVFAYQLLPCDSSRNVDDTPLQLLQQVWEKARLEKLTGGKAGLLSFPASWLENLPDLSLLKQQLIICANWQALDEQAEKNLKELATQGYLIAIATHHYAPQLAKKLDFATLLAVEAGEAVKEIGPFLDEIHAKGLKLLVNQVETREQYDAAFDAGFDYFQGDFFQRPRLIQGTHIPANRLAILRLLARLQDPDITIEEVENLVSQDVTLSYKILRLINAAFYGLPKKVDSIKRAVVFFGLNRIKQWAMVIAINAIDYEPRELIITALVRARTCEQIAGQLGREDAEQYYISGLFSLLDAIMDAPMEEILQRLNLTDEINQALLYGNGPIGQVLQSTLSLERGICHRLPLPQLDLQNTMQAYLEAIEAAESIRHQLEKSS